MRQSFKRRQVVGALAAALGVGLFRMPAALAPEPVHPRVSAAEAKRIRAVVQGQLEAFEADDARRAFSYATPAIREVFGTPERFIDMVRTGYPAVVRHTSVVYFTPEWVADELVQSVQLTDERGSVWLATYRMQRQPDKSWRINGCEVVENPRSLI